MSESQIISSLGDVRSQNWLRNEEISDVQVLRFGIVALGPKGLLFYKAFHSEDVVYLSTTQKFSQIVTNCTGQYLLARSDEGVFFLWKNVNSTPLLDNAKIISQLQGQEVVSLFAGTRFW